MPLIPALRKQADFCESEAGPIYIERVQDTGLQIETLSYERKEKKK